MSSPDSGSGGGFVDGQLDWGDKGGKCWECWVCNPCCGGYCCLTWFCCGSCNTCRMYSFALDQECAAINHCIPVCFCGACVGCSMRNALRRKAGIKGGGPMDGFIADCLFSWCCGACTFCQELRGAHIMGGQSSWDFLAEKKNFKVDPLKFPPFME
eukprot:Rhum_TRINITY_DN14847_c11_g1::Rhum_TRINITY_DN14847_c11_g1_i1::g.125724::m.125724